MNTKQTQMFIALSMHDINDVLAKGYHTESWKSLKAILDESFSEFKTDFGSQFEFLFKEWEDAAKYSQYLSVSQ
jgi:hypothetical protein